MISDRLVAALMRHHLMYDASDEIGDTFLLGVVKRLRRHRRGAYDWLLQWMSAHVRSPRTAGRRLLERIATRQRLFGIEPAIFAAPEVAIRLLCRHALAPLAGTAIVIEDAAAGLPYATRNAAAAIVDRVRLLALEADFCQRELRRIVGEPEEAPPPDRGRR